VGLTAAFIMAAILGAPAAYGVEGIAALKDVACEREASNANAI
jgi:hypothetical protein